MKKAIDRIRLPRRKDEEDRVYQQQMDKQSLLIDQNFQELFRMCLDLEERVKELEAVNGDL